MKLLTDGAWSKLMASANLNPYQGRELKAKFDQINAIWDEFMRCLYIAESDQEAIARMLAENYQDRDDAVKVANNRERLRSYVKMLLGE